MNYLLPSSKRITFRLLQLEDAARLFEIYSDQEAMQYRGTAPMQTLSDAHEFIHSSIRSEAGQVILRQAMILAEDRQLIGSIIYKHHLTNNQLEIGYSLAPAYWNRGLASEALAQMVQHLRHQDASTTLLAWSKAANIGSIKVLEKNNFVQINPYRYFEQLDPVKYKDALLFEYQN